MSCSDKFTPSAMTKREIIVELKRLGWKRKRASWYSPHHKRIHQGITLREAASLELLTASESLSNTGSR